MSHHHRAAIVGVTGFIGEGLPALLAERGVATTGVSRAGKGTVAGADRWQTPDALDFSGHDIIINLAGESIDRRWTESAKQQFHQSRVGITGDIVSAIRRLPEGQRPAVLVNASAVGIYGDRGDEVLTDDAAPGEGYLAELCLDWENAARGAESLGVRVVCLRIGVVLGKDGGAYRKLRRIFNTGVGGRLGNGTQWMPWIHLHDLRAAIIHALFSRDLTGPVNATAPEPERNADFTRKLAAALHRPAVLPAPALFLKAVLGEFSSALLASQRTVPAALDTDGFTFRFPTLDSALEDLTR